MGRDRLALGAFTGMLVCSERAEEHWTFCSANIVIWVTFRWNHCLLTTVSKGPGQNQDWVLARACSNPGGQCGCPGTVRGQSLEYPLTSAKLPSGLSVNAGGKADKCDIKHLSDCKNGVVSKMRKCPGRNTFIPSSFFF